MQEYGCCPKFKRGDNSTYTFTKRGRGMYLVSATPSKLMDGRTDRVIPIYPSNFVCGGHNYLPF
jgi:hypothetical protein